MHFFIHRLLQHIYNDIWNCLAKKNSYIDTGEKCSLYAMIFYMITHRAKSGEYHGRFTTTKRNKMPYQNWLIQVTSSGNLTRFSFETTIEKNIMSPNILNTFVKLLNFL